VVAILTPIYEAETPFAGPEAVLAYLARYTHRVAISTADWSASTRAA
jgi:hypothetical protein